MRPLTHSEMLTFRAPRGLVAVLRQIAREHETSVSEFIRQAVEAKAGDGEKKEKG